MEISRKDLKIKELDEEIKKLSHMSSASVSKIQSLIEQQDESKMDLKSKVEVSSPKKTTDVI